jgi:predicted amidohydrolase YtcJ
MTADLVVRAQKVYTMDPAVPVAAGLAVQDGEIVAVARNARELDEQTGPDTTILGGEDVVVLPAFIDTHNHLMLSAHNVLGVPVSQAGGLGQLIGLIRERAAATPQGQWIITAADWHENRLAERRLPTAAELDRATSEHPVLVLRGGHNGVLNSAGLRLAGIGPETPDLKGGFIARDAAGHPAGWVQDAALDHARRVLPPVPADDLAAALAQASARYASHGIGTVKDAAVSPAEWQAYREARSSGRLSVRSHAMIWTTPAAVAAAGSGSASGSGSGSGSMDAYLDGLEAQGIRPGEGDAVLRVWGLKLVLDGGVEAAALEQPYPARPGYHGELLWDPGVLTEVLTVAARRGWPVGTHAFGDRAVAVLLDAIGAVRQRAGRPEVALVIEHGGLIGDRIGQARDLGVHVTVQQPLLDGLAHALIAEWGPERPAELFPMRELLDAGVAISAGTDHPIGPLDPLRAIHGMITRQTPAGVLGPGHAIRRDEAFRLYTTAGAALLGSEGGRLARGAPADLVAYPADPMTCDPAQLLSLVPAFTVLEGRVTHVGR